jgi:hypothetical protein
MKAKFVIKNRNFILILLGKDFKGMRGPFVVITNKKSQKLVVNGVYVLILKVVCQEFRDVVQFSQLKLLSVSVIHFGRSEELLITIILVHIQKREANDVGLFSFIYNDHQ